MRPGRKIGVGERSVFRRAGRTAGGSHGPRQLRRAPHPVCSRAGFLCAKSSASATCRFRPILTAPTALADRERYQTIYARERGSVAAPTAGLHFTPEILARMKERGIETAEVTLHVGLGTFQPVREERVEDHRLHRESYSISAEAAAAINRAWMPDGESWRWEQPRSGRSNILPRNRAGSTGGKRRGRHLYLSRLSNSAWWARCSPISTCRNPHCSCWCAPWRPAASARRISSCRGRALQVLFLWRLHVRGVSSHLRPQEYTEPCRR